MTGPTPEQRDPVHSALDLADRPGTPADTTDDLTNAAASTDARGEPAPPVPVVGGRYQVLRELGRGGMGVVYQARDARTGRVVAVKTMRLTGGRALELFKGEFRYLQGVSHPHLVQLHSLEADGERWLLTMEYVDGTDLRTHLLGEDHAQHTRSMVSRPPADVTRSLPAMDSLVTASVERSLGATVTHDHTRIPRRAGTPVADLDKLRSAFGQLAEGVAALHAHRRVHRDLKPANVRVTPDGRVVVLDFGLTAALDQSGEYLASALAGTAPYLAPEQGDSPPVVVPASDWYAVGVMLYEALTGQFPFVGGLRQTLAEKRRGVRVRPSHLRPDVPTDLEELCLALLSPNPAARPAAAAVLAAFGRQAPPVVATGAGETRLLGRDRQLEALRWAWAEGRGGRAVVVRLSGPSGVGKSALVEHFANELQGAGAVVLSGRCYEHESVPYKALDPIVDELARHLHAATGAEAEALSPEHAASLLRVFPVLERVGPLFDRAAGARLSPDPQEVRRQAFAGLREVLGRLATTTPLVIHIDDLQWGDIDSAYLLSDLLRPPAAPAVVWLLAHRSEDAASACLTTLWEALARVGVPVREVAVDPLTEAESQQLALSLLGTEREAQADQVAREAGGNPFFVAELARAAAAGVGVGGEELTLDGLIRSRVAKLPAGERRLLEVVAVSGRPLTDLDAYRASGDDAGDPRGHFARLEAASLLRGVGEAGTIELETYHDRVREAVLAGLERGERRGHHGRLAAVLEESGRGDLEELAIHFEGAGERERAGEYYHRAGDKSSRSMAFDQASGFYRRALDLLRLEDAGRRELRLKLADALSDAGRGAEAGPIYRDFSEETEGIEQLDLRRKAMNQFLFSGHTEEGLTLLKSLFVSLGQTIPGGPRRAIARLLLEVLRLRVRGVHFMEKAEEALSREEMWRLDLLYAAGWNMYRQNSVIGSYFFLRAARWALNAGEPGRVTRALGSAGTVVGLGGGKQSRLLAADWIQKANEVADRLGEPYWRAYMTMKKGFYNWGLGQWAEAIGYFDDFEPGAGEGQLALAAFQPDVVFFGLLAHLAAGRWKECSSRVAAYSEDAQRRGDLYSLNAMLALSTLDGIILGRPDLVEERLRESEDLSQRVRCIPHLIARIGTIADVELYQGRGRAALNRVNAELPKFSKDTQYDLVEIWLLQTHHTQGRVRIAAAVELGNSVAANREQAKLLREASRFARKIEKRQRPWADPLAKLLRAGIANLRGDTHTAVATLAAAATEFDAADMRMYAAAARRQRGRLIGGKEGRELIRQADEFMTGEGVVEPDRIAAMLAPGFPD